MSDAEPTGVFGYEIYIRATPDEVWSALTDPEQTRRFWYGALRS
jgi:uncharacterized protein YndB with AHSA1/START domain